MKQILTIMTTFILASAPYAQAQLTGAEINETLQVTSHAQLNFEQTKRQIALDLSQQYSTITSTLKTEINEYNLAVNADDIAPTPEFNSQMLMSADQHVRQAKGLDKLQSALVQIRLADKSMLNQWQAGESPLFAFAPDGNDNQWDYIEAFDVEGNLHKLDVYTLPECPVFVIGLDNKKALKAGLQMMRDTFAQARRHPAKSQQFSAMTSEEAPQPLLTTVLKQILLQDDHEPWISGDAEIYGIVTGIEPNAIEPVLNVVEMPYLDHSETVYSPNQIMIYWERYRWSAVDMILMEHDDGTNYKEVATKLLDAAERILSEIPDPDVQGYAIIPQITNKILSQLPDDLFTNDDDYVDVFYTLQENTEYSDYMGASGNATISMEPLTINPR